MQIPEPDSYSVSKTKENEECRSTAKPICKLGSSLTRIVAGSQAHEAGRRLERRRAGHMLLVGEGCRGSVEAPSDAPQRGSAMNTIRIIIVMAIAISTSASLADDEAERNWCGKLLTPRSCGREVVRIERYLKARDTESFRTGQGFNTGNSLVGCSVNCARRQVGYVADDEKPDGPCTYSAMAMQRFEKLHGRSVRHG